MFYKQFDIQLKNRASLSSLTGEFSVTHLAGFQEVKANIGVPGYWIQAVLTEVLVDIFWCRLGQETVYTLPNGKRSEKTVSEKNNWKLLTLLSKGHIPFCSKRSTYPVRTSRGGNDVWNHTRAHFLVKHLEIKACVWREGMCVRVFGKQGKLQRVRIIISTPSPLSQHLKRGFSLSPAPHHPARVHGCQETTSDTGAHGPERL